MIILNNKLQSQGAENERILAHARKTSNAGQQSAAHLNEQWERRFQQQNQIIEKLLMKLSENGIAMSDESIMELQGGDLGDQQQDQGMDIIVSYGPTRPDEEPVTKQMIGA